VGSNPAGLTNRIKDLVQKPGSSKISRVCTVSAFALLGRRHWMPVKKVSGR
jgi:hypothetical protein